jgi:hypothetical protein
MSWIVVVGFVYHLRYRCVAAYLCVWLFHVMRLSDELVPCRRSPVNCLRTHSFTINSESDQVRGLDLRKLKNTEKTQTLVGMTAIKLH